MFYFLRLVQEWLTPRPHTRYCPAHLLVCLLGACATGPAYDPADRPDDDQARVYIYRKTGIVGAARTHTIRQYGAAIGEIVNGSYLKLDVYPKPAVLRLTGDGCYPYPDTVNVNLERGKTYFVEALVGGVYTGDGAKLNTYQFGCALVQRSTEVGERDMQGLRRVK